MESTLFNIIDICKSNNIEITFIKELELNGLIELTIIESQEFVYDDQITQIEKYLNWYNELELNMQGIGIVQSLLYKIEKLQTELKSLKHCH